METTCLIMFFFDNQSRFLFSQINLYNVQNIVNIYILLYILMTYDKHFFNQINYFYRFFLKTEKLSCPLSFISVNSKRVFICYSLTLKHILNFSFFKVLKLCGCQNILCFCFTYLMLFFTFFSTTYSRLNIHFKRQFN